MIENAATVIVRPFQAADSAAVATIYLESRAATFLWLDASRWALSDFERDTEGENVLVADRDGRVVGFSSVWAPENFLHHLYVAPWCTGEGVGSALLEATLRVTGRPMRLKCKARNIRALAFYRARDWRTIEHGETEGDPYELMELRD